MMDSYEKLKAQRDKIEDNIAKKVITTVVTDAIKLLFVRNCGVLHVDEDGATEEEMIQDIVNVLTGEDTGCLDPNDADDLVRIRKTITLVRTPLNKAMNYYAELLYMVNKVIPLLWVGNFKQVCAGCGANMFEFAPHSNDCIVVKLRKLAGDKS